MPTEYTSKRQQIADHIDNTFFPEDGTEPVYAVPRADLNLLMLREFGAAKGTIDSVLETFVAAGVLKVTEKKVARVDEDNIDEVNSKTDLIEKAKDEEASDE